MHKDLKMEEQIKDYDMVIVHYFNAKLFGKDETQKAKEVF